MKRKLFLSFGVLVVFGFVLVGCDTGDDILSGENPKSIKITGVTGSDIPNEYNMIRIRVFPDFTDALGIAGQGGVHISSQTIQAPLVIVQNGGTSPASPAWTSNGRRYIALYFVKSDNTIAATFWYTNGGSFTGRDNLVKYDFTEELTVINFSKFKKEPQKTVTIGNISSLTGQAGVFIFSDLPEGDSFPQMSAIQYWTTSGNTISVGLVVPRDNTYNNGTNGIPNSNWTGNGDYYVAIIPVSDGSLQDNEARIFVDGGNSPVKKNFNEALVTLDFGKFKKWADL